MTLTIEEKLEHFKTICFDDVTERSTKVLAEYTDSLKKSLEEHKLDTRRQADMQVEMEREQCTRELNRQLSVEQINIKRQYSRKQEEYKAMLINELSDRLALFMESRDYEEYLASDIKQALSIAGDAAMTIYLDPSDEKLINQLTLRTGADIRRSETSFLGGIRAEIPSKNILIDNSFSSKLEELSQKFQFRLGGR